jgi:serine/threonine-protein kinase
MGQRSHGAQDLALTYVLLGDRTAALDILERLLSVPARFSPQLLRLDPLWEPLRGDPRFERLASRARDTVRAVP